MQERLLDLDAPITRYLPEFTVRSRFESASQDRITLRLLLANRAGFTHEAPVGNNYEASSPGFEAHVRSIAQTWLRFPVGERYRYSNLGFDLAGYILGRVAGVGYAEWLQRKLFGPLGMRDSTADPAVFADAGNRAVGSQEGYGQVPRVTPLVASGGDYGLGVMRTEMRHGATPVRLLHHRRGGGGFGFGCMFTYCPGGSGQARTGSLARSLPDREAIDFRGTVPTWRNLLLRRI